MKNLVLLLLLSFLALCPRASRGEVFFQSKSFKVAVGAEYLNLLAKRGVVTYNGWQVIPIYAIDLWSEDLQLVGSTLNYRFWIIPQVLLYRTRFVPKAAGDRPLYITNEREGDRIRRGSSMESDHFIELVDAKYGEISLQYSQAIGSQKGSYGEVSVRPVFYNGFYQSNGRPLLQAGLVGTIGYGSKAHNSYLYGSQSSGWTNYSFGLAVTSPAVIDPFYPVLKIVRSGLLGSAASGTLVRERQHWQVIALAAFRVF